MDNTQQSSTTSTVSTGGNNNSSDNGSNANTITIETTGAPGSSSPSIGKVGVGAVVEEKPKIPLNILEIIKKSQTQNGVRRQEYHRYRFFLILIHNFVYMYIGDISIKFST